MAVTAASVDHDTVLGVAFEPVATSSRHIDAVHRFRTAG